MTHRRLSDTSVGLVTISPKNDLHCPVIPRAATFDAFVSEWPDEYFFRMMWLSLNQVNIKPYLPFKCLRSPLVAMTFQWMLVISLCSEVFGY
jgi:hypothetical protein